MTCFRQKYPYLSCRIIFSDRHSTGTTASLYDLFTFTSTYRSAPALNPSPTVLIDVIHSLVVDILQLRCATLLGCTGKHLAAAGIMGLGWKFALVNSAIDTVLFVQILALSSIRVSYALTFSAILSIHFFSLALYKIILWPKLLSPLRGLPEPEVSATCAEYITWHHVDQSVQ